MLEERCFICGSRIGRGMHPSQGAQERIEKLVSVTQSVAHSSTIICDILSRILNETVLEDESICKICFNLLSDVDYHLKEAQEKTDEVTNKFLDKKRYVQSYQPKQPLTTVNVHEGYKSSKSVHHESYKSPKKRRHEEEDLNLTEDEMSVNTINKNKAKLLSHVLNPHKKAKPAQPPVQPTPPTQKAREISKEEKTKSDHHHHTSSRKESKRRSKKTHSKKYVDTSTDEEEGDNDDSDGENVIVTKKKKSSNELMTVNMDDLGDLLSKPADVYFAKKSTPAKRTDEPLTCDICDKTFKKTLNLQLHKEKMHEINSKPIVSQPLPESHKCPNCVREFTSEHALLKHLEDHQNDKFKSPAKKPATPIKNNRPPAKDEEVKATCPHCNQTFRRLYNMKVHVDRVHNKVKPYKCDNCNKSFTTNSDLKQHLSTHGQGKKFTCEICDRVFSNRDSIILHKKQHNQEKTHFCSICFKGFYKASCLTRHMRSHTGERPYACEFCYKTFSQSTTLRQHKDKCTKTPQQQQQNPPPFPVHS